MAASAIAIEAVSKRFGGTQALDDVSLALSPGAVHAVVGENGAGKSTLIKILGGVVRPDQGRVLVAGRPQDFQSPADALAAGIAAVSQDVRVVPGLTVAENVMLGHLPARRALGLLPIVDRRRMRDEARAALARLNFDPDLDQPAGALTYAGRQLMAIARALSQQARVLILDEPTAALERREVGRLFDTVRALAEQGVAVLFISHRLDEVVEIADDCTVLRDGRVVGQAARGVFDADWLVRRMTGRDLEELHRPHALEFGAAVLEADVPAEPPGPRELRLRAGQVLGLAGLLDCGATGLLRRLFGAEGAIRLRRRGSDATFAHPADAIAAGVGLVPGERSSALVLGLSIRDNIVLPNLRRFRRLRLGRREIDGLVGRLMDELDIRPRDAERLVRELSGGNQQKVIFAKWLAARADLLLLDEPTQGIDVGAKVAIHRLMREFAAEGGAIIFASAEAHEVLALSDAVLALRRGRVVARLKRGVDYTERTLRAALGG
ncbi:MAG TPA: sugar ABC transporter ATP-binding protein [Alphaproteobacteria bacterium]